MRHGDQVKYLAPLAVVMGCAMTPPRDLPHPGPEPTAAQAENIARGYLETVLKDPDSLKAFKIIRGPYQRDYLLDIGVPWRRAYVVCFTYNAKNSYGAYAGSQLGVVTMTGANPAPRLIDAIPEIHRHIYC